MDVSQPFNARASINEMQDLIGEMRSSLELYKKFIKSDVPRHKGIPYMAASESFSTSIDHPYGKFWRLFKQTCQETGMTSLWYQAQDSWIPRHKRAMGILFPRGPGEIVVKDFFPTLKTGNFEKDPDRAHKALPVFIKVVEEIEKSVNDLELTLQFEEDEEINEIIVNRVVNRLREKL
jgi:hypothetical protein